jgi:hypothetical protein
MTPQGYAPDPTRVMRGDPKAPLRIREARLGAGVIDDHKRGLHSRFGRHDDLQPHLGAQAREIRAEPLRSEPETQ